MKETLTVVGHADNRPGASRNGKREPLVQVLATHYGDVHSFTFPPERAPEIAEAILKAARAAKRGKDSEREFLLKDE